MTSSTYLNFGAGNPVEGWTNVDSSPFFALPPLAHRLIARLSPAGRSARFAATTYQFFRFTAEKPLPFVTQSVAAVYCSHVFEHLPAGMIPPLLDEFARILQPGGVARIIVPDLKAAAERALQGGAAWVSLDEQLGTLPPDLSRSPVRAALEGFFGFPSFHKTLLLPEQLTKSVDARWTVRRSIGYLDSRIDIEKLRLVELEERCQDAVVVELVRTTTSTGGTT